MELIRIGDSKLKITLTSDDMSAYELDPDTMDYDNTETRRAFWDILDHAKHATGFDAAGDRVFVQLYPGKKGGCEMYITKLGMICAEKGERERERAGKYSGERTRPGTTRPLPAVIPSPTACPIPVGSDGRDRVGAYRFEQMSDLLSVCRQLAAQGYEAHSSAFRDERDRYFLLLCQRVSPFGVPDGEYSFITEFGTPENADVVRLYISEHGTPLCEGDAVRTLARF